MTITLIPDDAPEVKCSGTGETFSLAAADLIDRIFLWGPTATADNNAANLFNALAVLAKGNKTETRMQDFSTPEDAFTLKVSGHKIK